MPDGSVANEPLVLCRLLEPGEPLDLAELEQFVVEAPSHGAIVSFLGVVRPMEEGELIDGLFYEIHPTLARRELERVVGRVASRHDVARLACAHRTGFVPAGQASVAIYVSAAHRLPAFAACQEAIAELKRCVPIWKSIGSRR